MGVCRMREHEQEINDEEQLMDGIARALSGMEDDFGPLPDEEILSGSGRGAFHFEEKIGRGKALPGFIVFLLTFMMSLLLLIAVMLGVLKLTSKNGTLFGSSVPSENVTASGVDLSLDYYHPELSDDGRLLVICGGTGDAQALPVSQQDTAADFPTFFWILRINPRNGSMTILSLPGETLAGEGTLSEAAGRSGAKAVSAVEMLLGEKSIDHYLFISHADAASLITELGGMEWEFSDRYRSDALDIPVGRHLLDGETVLRLMAEGDAGAKALPGSADILSALLGQKFTEDAFNKDDSLFQSLAAHSSGNVSIMDYYDGKKFLRWYLHMKAGCRTVALMGEKGDGGVVLSEGEVNLAREKLGISEG